MPQLNPHLPSQVPVPKPRPVGLEGAVAAAGLAGAATGVAAAAAAGAVQGAKDQLQVNAAAGQTAANLGFVEDNAKAEAQQASIERLKEMKPAELARLGRAANKREFFQALLPAALESERKYGVPAEVTLAQAALESGWARSPIGGYNIFGIKGSGPAGSVKLDTKEGAGVASRARFAKFNNFHEAVGEHGQLYNNGNYDRAMKQYSQNKDPMKFVDGIARTYATAPNYASQLKSMIRKYNLQGMANAAR